MTGFSDNWSIVRFLFSSVHSQLQKAYGACAKGICGINYTKMTRDNDIVYLSSPTGARGSEDTGLN